jgi:reactive intermediate/imine deaminase
MRLPTRIGILMALICTAWIPLRPAQAPVKKFLTTNGAKPTGLFAPGVAVGSTVYIAGKGDYSPNAEFPDKVRNCLGEVQKTLKVAGLDISSVVATHCYLEDPANYAKFNEAYGEFFQSRPPSRTSLGVPAVPGDSRVEITVVAYADPAGIKQIGPVKPGLPFSPGILAGDTLYISGKGDQLPDGTHPATVEEQVRQTMRNVESVLKEAGLDFRHVVFNNVYLDNWDNYAALNKVYSEFFEYGNEPARSTVFVDWIPGGSHFEITCIATTNLSARKVVRPASMKFGPDERAVTASPAVWAGDTLYISGLYGMDPANGKPGPDLDKQIRLMAQGDIDILSAAGLKLEDIVSGHVYLRSIDDYKPFNDVYQEFYSKGPGVRTCLMPSSGIEKNDIRVRASFIAARTQ